MPCFSMKASFVAIIIIYKSVWSPTLGEIVSIDCEHRNTHDRHAVGLLKGGSIIGHAPRELGKYFGFSLDMVDCSHC